MSHFSWIDSFLFNIIHQQQCSVYNTLKLMLWIVYYWLIFQGPLFCLLHFSFLVPSKDMYVRLIGSKLPQGANVGVNVLCTRVTDCFTVWNALGWLLLLNWTIQDVPCHFPKCCPSVLQLRISRSFCTVPFSTVAVCRCSCAAASRDPANSTSPQQMTGWPRDANSNRAHDFIQKNVLHP